MSGRMKIILLLLVLGVVGTGAFWMKPAEAQKAAAGGEETLFSQEGKTPTEFPLAQLNDKAQTAKSGDEKAVTELADEVFNSAALEDAPAALLDAAKGRLIQAEINYRAGKGQGIEEINVARAVTGLAIRLDAPVYARASTYEVRRLRMSLLPLAPQLIGQGRVAESSEKSAKDAGSSINAEMSPMEAVFVTLMMFQQKQTNEDYQVTPSERRSNWAATHSGKQRTLSAKVHQLSEAEATNRQTAMTEALNRGFSNMKPSELMEVPYRVMNVLGIAKEGSDDK